MVACGTNAAYHHCPNTFDVKSRGYVLNIFIKFHRWFIIPSIPIIMKHFKVSIWDEINFYFFIPNSRRWALNLFFPFSNLVLTKSKASFPVLITITLSLARNQPDSMPICQFVWLVYSIKGGPKKPSIPIPIIAMQMSHAEENCNISNCTRSLTNHLYNSSVGKKSTLIQCDFFSLLKQANWHQARDQEEATLSQCSADLQQDIKSTEKVIFFY